MEAGCGVTAEIRGPNDWLRALITTAEANGWQVTGYQAHFPGAFVKVTDYRGTSITIEGNHGLDFPAYLANLKAIEKPVLKPVLKP